MPSASKTLFSGARLLDPATGEDAERDVLVSGRVVEAVENAGKGEAGARVTVVDCSGLILAPGLVDLHTHLREPGYEDRETVESGTRAAAAGGYTAVTAMANTDPVADNASVVEEVISLAARFGAADVFPVGAITKGLAGEVLSEIGEMAALGVRLFSDDGRCVPDARTVRMAMEYAKAFDVVIAEHCEDVSLTDGWQMHEGATSSRLGLAGAPAASEEVIVARDLTVTKLTGGRLHVCHVSSAGSVELIRRAKAEGVRVTAEVTPHHLVFTDEDLEGYDTNFKVNPPLRTSEDREVLIEGLSDGTIDAVATDHAPHAVQDKEQEFAAAPPGTIGLETALAAVWTALVRRERLSPLRAIEVLSSAPARILGAGEHGGPVEAGRPANLVVFDPAAEWVVDNAFESASGNSAFLGRSLAGRVVHTMRAGRFTVTDGKVTA